MIKEKDNYEYRIILEVVLKTQREKKQFLNNFKRNNCKPIYLIKMEVQP